MQTQCQTCLFEDLLFNETLKTIVKPFHKLQKIYGNGIYYFCKQKGRTSAWCFFNQDSKNYIEWKSNWKAEENNDSITDGRITPPNSNTKIEWNAAMAVLTQPSTVNAETPDNEFWVFNCACSRHICSNESLFADPRKETRYFQVDNKEFDYVVDIGNT